MLFEQSIFAVFQCRIVRIVLGQPREFALDPDELAARIAVFLQPVGEYKARGAIGGIGNDGLEEGLFVVHGPDLGRLTVEWLRVAATSRQRLYARVYLGPTAAPAIPSSCRRWSWQWVPATGRGRPCCDTVHLVRATFECS